MKFSENATYTRHHTHSVKQPESELQNIKQEQEEARRTQKTKRSKTGNVEKKKYTATSARDVFREMKRHDDDRPIKINTTVRTH